MPRLTPLSHRKLVKKLESFGFIGPISGGRHVHMKKGSLVIPVPKHGGKDIPVGLISMIIKEVGVTREERIDAK